MLHKKLLRDQFQNQILCFDPLRSGRTITHLFHKYNSLNANKKTNKMTLPLILAMVLRNEYWWSVADGNTYVPQMACLLKNKYALSFKLALASDWKRNIHPSKCVPSFIPSIFARVFLLSYAFECVFRAYDMHEHTKSKISFFPYSYLTQLILLQLWYNSLALQCEIKNECS